jgi:hypothetical protein
MACGLAFIKWRSCINLVAVDGRQRAGHDGWAFEVYQSLHDGRQAGASHGIVFSKHGNAVLVERGAVAGDFERFVSQAGANVKRSAGCSFTQGI